MRNEMKYVWLLLEVRVCTWEGFRVIGLAVEVQPTGLGLHGIYGDLLTDDLQFYIQSTYAVPNFYYKSKLQGGRCGSSYWPKTA